MAQHFRVRSPAEGLRVIEHPAITKNFEKALRVRPKHKNAVLVPCAGTKPFPEAPSHKSGYLPALEGKRADLWVVSEPLGVVPYEWSTTWPNDAYDFPPKYLTGAAREALVERIGRWLDRMVPKYENVYLALPGHHRRVLDEALEGRDLKIRDVGHGACIEAGACPAGHGRATSHKYRAYLKGRIPNPAAKKSSLWLMPKAKPETVSLHPRFDDYAYFHESYEMYAESPRRFSTPVEVRWVPLKTVREPVYVDNEDEEEAERVFIADVARRMKRGEDIPPAILEHGKLFDGRHRILAAEELGLKRVPVVDMASWPRKANPVKRRGGHLGRYLAEQFARGVSYPPPLPVGMRVLVPRAASETDFSDEGAFVAGTVIAQRPHTGPDATSENTLVRFDRGSYWSGKESWYEPEYPIVMDDTRRLRPVARHGNPAAGSAAVLAEIQQVFPSVRLPTELAFREWLDEAVPIMIRTWMIDAMTLKVCSGISPDFAEIAAAHGYPVVTVSVPGHFYNVALTTNGPLEIDLSAAQFEVCRAGLRDFDDVDDPAYQHLKQVFARIERDPFSAIKVGSISEAELARMHYRVPHGKHPIEWNDPTKRYAAAKRRRR